MCSSRLLKYLAERSSRMKGWISSPESGLCFLEILGETSRSASDKRFDMVRDDGEIARPRFRFSRNQDRYKYLRNASGLQPRSELPVGHVNDGKGLACRLTSEAGNFFGGQRFRARERIRPAFQS